MVDDGVGGYMDNGMDDFEETDMHAHSDEEGKKSKCRYKATLKTRF